MRTPSADLLRTFVAVAETRSFTLAAQRRNLGQSTVSQQIKRLEDLLGRTVLARNTHSVAPTPDGDALLDLARRALDTHDRIERFITGSELRGRLRLGVTEDFVLAGLHNVLAAFSQQNPSIDLELTVGLSGALYEGFDAGEMDVVFTKRRLGDTRGQVAWRERLVWIGRPGIRPDPPLPVLLLLFPPPSITRMAALDALERAGRPRRSMHLQWPQRPLCRCTGRAGRCGAFGPADPARAGHHAGVAQFARTRRDRGRRDRARCPPPNRVRPGGSDPAGLRQVQTGCVIMSGPCMRNVLYLSHFFPNTVSVTLLRQRSASRR